MEYDVIQVLGKPIRIEWEFQDESSVPAEIAKQVQAMGLPHFYLYVRVLDTKEQLTEKLGPYSEEKAEAITRACNEFAERLFPQASA